jgi:uncharacterized RDD family membrane protein YckC
MDEDRVTSTGGGDWSNETGKQKSTAPDREMTAVTGGRVGAQLIDTVFLGVQFLAVLWVLQSGLGLGNEHDLQLYASLTLPLYGGLLEGIWNGQTIGKRLMRIKVTDGENTPSLPQAFIRNLPAGLLFVVGTSSPLIVLWAVVPLLVGFTVIKVSDHRQRFLDHVVGTYVVAADESVVNHETKGYLNRRGADVSIDNAGWDDQD